MVSDTSDVITSLVTSSSIKNPPLSRLSILFFGKSSTEWHRRFFSQSQGSQVLGPVDIMISLVDVARVFEFCFNYLEGDQS